MGAFIFYDSCYKENKKSEMAEKWLMEHGCFDAKNQTECAKKYCKKKASPKKKAATTKKSGSKKKAAPKKKKTRKRKLYSDDSVDAEGEPSRKRRKSTSGKKSKSKK